MTTWDGMVTIAPGVYTSMPPWSQRCTACGNYTDHDDNLSLHYVRHDGVPGSSYPMCRHCRPERISRLASMGFTDIEARGRASTNPADVADPSHKSGATA